MFSRSRRHDRHNRLQTAVTANGIGSVLDSSHSSNSREAFATGHTTRKSPSNKRAIGSGSLLLDEYDEFDEIQDNQEKQLVSHNYHDHSNIQASQHPKRKKCGRGGVAKPFPLKLYHMLQQVDKEEIADIISWQPHGRCFHVRNPKAFVSQVLHRFFQQKKLASFQRQLNLYGFNRITAGPDKGSYYHEFFLRGKGFLIQNIYRIKVKGTGARLASNPDAEPKFYNMPFLEEEEEEDQLQYNDVEDFDNAVTTAVTTAATTATPQLDTENTGRLSNPEEGTKVVDSREDTAVSASTYALPDSSKSRPSKRRSSLSSRRRRSIEALMKEMPAYGETMTNQPQHEMPPLSSSATSSMIDYTSPYFNNAFGETIAPLPLNTMRTQQRRRSSLLSLSNFILDDFMNTSSARSSSSSSATYGGGVRRGSAGSFHHQDYNNIPTAAPAPAAFSYPSLQYDPASTNMMTESRSPQDFYRKKQQLSPELVDLMMLSNRQDLPLGGGSFHPY